MLSACGGWQARQNIQSQIAECEIVTMPTSDVVGMWICEAYPYGSELLILKVADRIEFKLSVFRTYSISGIATIEYNQIVFNEDDYSGTLEFFDGNVLLTITHSNYPDMTVGDKHFFIEKVEMIEGTVIHRYEKNNLLTLFFEDGRGQHISHGFPATPSFTYSYHHSYILISGEDIRWDILDDFGRYIEGWRIINHREITYNDTKIYNIYDMFEYIIKNENFKKPFYNKLSQLLDDIGESSYHASENGWLIETANVDIQGYGDYGVTRIRIRPQSTYMQLFPYTTLNEYLSNYSENYYFGEIDEQTDNMLYYKWITPPEDIRFIDWKDSTIRLVLLFDGFMDVGNDNELVLDSAWFEFWI
jgi:hypothetical protein